MLDFQKRREKFDREFDRMGKAINVMFVFTTLLIIAILTGSGYVVVKVLLYFGILP